jgi:short subunit dehydrogenase-like uncharacterized protein
MRDHDIIVYGATGFTGRLVAEYLNQQKVARWAMAGRSRAKLEEVRDLIGAPADTPLIVADADDPASLGPMAASARISSTARHSSPPASPRAPLMSIYAASPRGCAI